jgi:hypothetical protein
MTVAELIVELSNLPMDAHVLLETTDGDDDYRTYEDPVARLHDLKRDRSFGDLEPVCGVVGEVVVGQGVILSAS